MMFERGKMVKKQSLDRESSEVQLLESRIYDFFKCNDLPLLS